VMLWVVPNSAVLRCRRYHAGLTRLTQSLAPELVRCCPVLCVWSIQLARHERGGSAGRGN
jgi:hypothetical protein